MNRQTPNISVTQLGNYFAGTPKQKENILRNRKYYKDNKFLSNRYNTVKAAVVRYIMDEKHSPAIFEKAKENILKKPVDSDWKVNDRKNSLEAITILEKNLDKFFKPFLKCHARRCAIPEKSVKLFLVEVGLNPEIILYDEDKNKIVGAIKLVFLKKKLTRQAGEMASTIVRDHLVKLHKQDILVNNCIVVDVFGKKIFCAPDKAVYRYYKRILKSTCLEIVQVWDKL